MEIEQRICLDTSTYFLPCDRFPNSAQYREALEEQKATMRIKQLAEEGKVQLCISAYVQNEIQGHPDLEKRHSADEFWRPVKLEILPQEIEFDGIPERYDIAEFRRVEKAGQGALRDESVDSLIALNAALFQMPLVTSNRKRMNKIKRELKGTVWVERPSEFLARIAMEQDIS